jgi:hypothetical protein
MRIYLYNYSFWLFFLVTSAVVFSYIVVVVTEHFTDMSIEWWTVLLTVGLTALVAYARVSVGSILLYLENRI